MHSTVSCLNKLLFIPPQKISTIFKHLEAWPDIIMGWTLESDVVVFFFHEKLLTLQIQTQLFHWTLLGPWSYRKLGKPEAVDKRAWVCPCEFYFLYELLHNISQELLSSKVSFMKYRGAGGWRVQNCPWAEGTLVWATVLVFSVWLLLGHGNHWAPGEMNVPAAEN